MNEQETKHLQSIVKRYGVLNDDIKERQDEQKALADAAYDKGLVRAANHQDARKVVKKLAKESTWDQVQREGQRLMDEALDECRAALGLLADLPLGQAAAQASVTDPAVRADGTLKRGRGRPPGSRNKPKLATVNGNVPPDVPDVPPPDVSDGAEDVRERQPAA